MPFWIPAAIAGVASLAGAAIGAKGQSDANSANAKQAQLNREFQERMRNTEFQARVKDLEAAGLNPALAYQQGGASAPSGNLPAPMQNTVSGIASSAQAALQLVNQTLQTNAQVELTREQTRATNVQAQTMYNQLPYAGPRAQAESETARAQADINEIEKNFRQSGLKDSLRQLNANASLAENNSALASTQRKLLQLSIPAARLRSRGFEAANEGLDFLEDLGGSALERAQEFLKLR